jgi:hypothetical protein
MSGALQIGRDIIGIAKQAGAGALAANPTFAHGAITATDPDLGFNQSDDGVTSGGRSPAGAYLSSIDEKMTIDTRAWQKAIGLYLLGLLGNDSVTGTGPYIHQLTSGLVVPYLSVFAKKGDGTIIALRDAKVAKLELSWKDNEPVDVQIELDGCVLSFPGTFVPGTDESGTLAYYTPVGGTFKYDITSNTPVAASVTAGKITLQQDLTLPVFSGAVEAGDCIEGNLSVDVSLDCIPADATLWRKIVTGAVGGAALRTVPQYGSFDVKFAKGADSLEFAAPNVAFLADLPGADAKGGPATMTIAGSAYPVSAGGTPITATLTNTVASY